MIARIASSCLVALLACGVRAAETPVAPPPPAAPAPLAPPAPSDAELAEVTALARGSAADLALALMDRLQGAHADGPERWERWERERLYVLAARRDWRALETRTRELPAGASPELRAAALTARADALLELGRAEEARAVLRGLVWSGAGPAGDAEFDRWRRLVLRSYIADGLPDDAAIAIQRRRQDDPGEAAQWSPIEAALLLRAKEPEQALSALAWRKDAVSQALALVAALRAGRQPAATAFDVAVKLAVAKSTPDDARAIAWAAAAEAAQAMGNPTARLAALERALVLPRHPLLPAGVLEVRAGDVWTAYEQLGLQLGNALQLVVGADADWFAAAADRFDTEPVNARALFSVVAARGGGAERDTAHWQFAQLVVREPNGGALLAALYLDGASFAAPEDVPAPVRYLLIDPVLARPDIPLASRLLAGLAEPPAGADPAPWHLRRARVFVLAGQVEAGVAALDVLLASGAPVDVDRFLQVVFDLQTLKEHEAALRFLTPLLGWELEPQRRRELLFWTADSHAALEHHVEAARLYLASALLVDAAAMDPWAQTARYQAAGALAKAGLYGDARRQYAALLNATPDPARQAVLRHEMQQLTLAEGRAVNPR